MSAIRYNRWADQRRTNMTTFLNSLGLPAPELDGWGCLFAHPDRFEAGEGEATPD